MPPENLGVRQVEEVTKDVTSLTNAGGEPLSTWSDDSGLDVIDAATVVGQENPGYHMVYDHIADEIAVMYADYDAAADGALIDVPSTTDVGEVKVRLEGRR